MLVLDGTYSHDDHETVLLVLRASEDDGDPGLCVVLHDGEGWYDEEILNEEFVTHERADVRLRVGFR